MDSIKESVIKSLNNVNVDKDNLINNVYDDVVASRIKSAIDKPKAIGEILSEKLNAPDNIKFYIKLAYQYSEDTLFECIALTEEAAREGKIKTDRPRYFYGIVRRKKKK